MYKAILYSDNTLTVVKVPIDDYDTYLNKVYDSFGPEGSYTFSVGNTEEAAIAILLEHFEHTVAQLKCDISEAKASVAAIKKVTRVPKCWECKHWGSVDYTGGPTKPWYGDVMTPEQSHVQHLRPYKDSTAPCPFFRSKDGFHCLMKPCYGKVCEHFELYQA